MSAAPIPPGDPSLATPLKSPAPARRSSDGTPLHGGDSPPSRLGTPGNPVRLRRTPSPVDDFSGGGGGGGGGGAEDAPPPRTESDDETVKEDVAFQLGRALLNVNEPWATEMYEQLLSPDGLSFEEQYEGIRHFSYQIQLWAALNELQDLPDSPTQNVHREKIRLRVRHHALAYIQFRFNAPSLEEAQMTDQQQVWFQQFTQELHILHAGIHAAPHDVLAHANAMPGHMVEMQFAYMAPFLEKVTTLTHDIARVFPQTHPETPASTRRRAEWDHFRFGETCLTVTNPKNIEALISIKESNSLMTSEAARSDLSRPPASEPAEAQPTPEAARSDLSRPPASEPAEAQPTPRRLDFNDPAAKPASCCTVKKLTVTAGIAGAAIGASFVPAVASACIQVAAISLMACKLTCGVLAMAILVHVAVPLLAVAVAAAATAVAAGVGYGLYKTVQCGFHNYSKWRAPAATPDLAPA